MHARPTDPYISRKLWTRRVDCGYIQLLDPTGTHELARSAAGSPARQYMRARPAALDKDTVPPTRDTRPHSDPPRTSCRPGV